MKPAEIDRTTVHIAVSGAKEHFVATGEVVRFDGFLKLYSESTDDDGAEGTSSGILPKMATGDSVEQETITATQRFTTPPARYNEALLVKKLEELGIGRPSTYAPTISTIINRGYVVKQNKEGIKRDYSQLTLKKGKVTEKTLSEKSGKEANRLAPTDIGMLVNDYLAAQFPNILDYNFTANVEKDFDEIAEGNEQWDKMIGRFYGDFHRSIGDALETQHTNTHQTRILGTDPATGHTVSARIGRFGPMVHIEDGKGGKGRFASLKKGQLVASITLEEALELLSLPKTLGQHNGEDVVVAIGKYGPYVRYNGKFTSLGRKDDPYTVTLERAMELIEEGKKEKPAGGALKTFAEDADLVVKSGRYGPYIAYKGKNYKLPKGTTPEELTLEETRKIVAESKK
jgi:DNA topoisomerase-1